jgi:hypothetical protein
LVGVCMLSLEQLPLLHWTVWQGNQYPCLMSGGGAKKFLAVTFTDGTGTVYFFSVRAASSLSAYSGYGLLWSRPPAGYPSGHFSVCLASLYKCHTVCWIVFYLGETCSNFLCSLQPSSLWQPTPRSAQPTEVCGWQGLRCHTAP